MALTFACPGCKAELQLPDELAGQSGQCPRCQRMILIPSPTQHRAVLLGAALPAPAGAKPATPARSQSSAADRDPARSRKPRTVPKRASGPIWPWLVGISGTLVCGGLLIAS